MSKLLGIDIRPSVVRAALLRTSYRRIALESLTEVDRSEYPDLDAALKSAIGALVHHGESIAIAVEGSQVYSHTLSIPAAASKQIEAVLPFELEAKVPVEFETLVYDSRILPRQAGSDQIQVLAAAVDRKIVEQRINLVRDAAGHEPECVTFGALSLSNLGLIAAPLREEAVQAIIDLGEKECEICFLERGMPVLARSLSYGIERFPEGADGLVRALKQMFVVWESGGETPVGQICICGGGAEIPGIVPFLAERLGVGVALLPALELEAIDPERVSELPRYAKAIAIALSLKGSSKSINLRQGDLAYQRGYGFLKQKIPLLVGLTVAFVGSFMFWAWAEGRALAHQNETLQAAVTELAGQTFGEEVEDVARINELLESGAKEEKDPQPDMDAFDLALLLAAQIPKTMDHDVDELDLQRGHVKLQGVVNTTEDAQKIAESLKKERCLKDVNITKITQQVKSSRQKYSMEFELRCQDIKKKSSGTEGEEG